MPTYGINLQLTIEAEDYDDAQTITEELINFINRSEPYRKLETDNIIEEI